MPKLTKRAIPYGRTYGLTGPNYRKASLLEIDELELVKNRRLYKLEPDYASKICINNNKDVFIQKRQKLI